MAEDSGRIERRNRTGSKIMVEREEFLRPRKKKITDTELSEPSCMKRNRGMYLQIVITTIVKTNFFIINTGRETA